jgi:hypothetical protein
LVRICTDLGLAELPEYTALLKKAESSNEAKQKVPLVHVLSASVTFLYWFRDKIADETLGEVFDQKAIVLIISITCIKFNIQSLHHYLSPC